jgi:cysteine-rich repeat protein
VSETGQNGEQYFMEEMDVVRYEYPELIKQHREWPHGYSYLQMKAGEDGEHVGNLFLKDYTQYSTESYYTDSITIPREMFENYVKAKPNGVQGEFPFTIKTPPGAGNIELLSMVFGYPVLKQEDASSYDSTDILTKRQSSHGPPPFFPHSAAWRGTDEHVSTPKTHPRFQTHAYTSTCGNGVLDAREGCDDANQNDGDGCSSACAVEDGWFCEIKTVASPSICRKGLVGETLLISTPF